jgi:hypothetical protein
MTCSECQRDKGHDPRCSHLTTTPTRDVDAWDRALCPAVGMTDDEIRAMVDAVLKAEGLGPPSL